MEKEEIKRTGGKAQKNSGRGKIQKGDATKYPFLYDVKEYEKSFSLSTDVWAKVCTDAWVSPPGDWVPALQVILGKGDDRIRLWVVDDDMMESMWEAWLEKYG